MKNNCSWKGGEEIEIIEVGRRKRIRWLTNKEGFKQLKLLNKHYFQDRPMPGLLPSPVDSWVKGTSVKKEKDGGTEGSATNEVNSQGRRISEV